MTLPDPEEPSNASKAETAAPLPPLSPGAPVLGNTLQFLQDTSKLLTESYQRLGPVYRLRALWLKYTVIGGFEAREFLREGLDQRYLSRQAIFEPVGKQLGDADFVLGQSGERHTRLRHVLSLAYSRQVASPWVPQFIRGVREHVARWQPGSEFSVMEQVERLAFEQYCQVMAGHSLGDYYRDCLLVTNYNMNIGGRVWPFVMYRAPWYQAARKRVLGLMWNQVRERRAAGPAPDRPPTIMDTLLRVQDDQGKHLTDDEVVCYSMYGFAGSCSYMGRVIGFMLYELLQHPELMEQVTQEVEQAFAEGLNDATDVRKLRLLQAVYHETLRYHPVSQGLPFYAEEDFVYAGKQVRKGDLTVLSQVPMSFSECPFHQPQTFDPARCLEPRSEHRKEGVFHPFGMGHRTCTAMGLVELMAVTMIATLLYDIHFTQWPKSYRLKLSVKPLPSPDAAFRIRVEGPRAHETRGAQPAGLVEEQVLASYPCLDDPIVKQALAEAQTRQFPAGAEIIREGDAADAFYMLLRGSTVVTRATQGAPQVLAQLREGDYFGEIGLLQDIPRTATVTAGDEGVETLVISRDAFLRVVAASDLVSEDLARIMRKRVATRRLLDAWPSLSLESLERVMTGFTSHSYPAGEVIIREGDEANHFFILTEGEVVVSRQARTGNEEEVARLHPGEYFGEMGLLYRAPRKATVTVAGSGPAKVLMTDQDGFHKLLGETGGMRADLARAMLGRIRKLAQHRS